MSNRPETGPMKFKDDWTGIFIRGDHSFACSMLLRNILDNSKDFNILTNNQLKELIDLLSSCNMNSKEYNRKEVQELKLFKECLDEKQD
jgi:hypothetical protein